MTQDEARRYCEDHGIGSTLTQSERLALSDEDFRMFVAAYSTGDASNVKNTAWATDAQARTAANIAKRDQTQQLRDAAGL